MERTYDIHLTSKDESVHLLSLQGRLDDAVNAGVDRVNWALRCGSTSGFVKRVSDMLGHQDVCLVVMENGDTIVSIEVAVMHHG